jgi:predicted secreted Zn-dependent protease
MSGELRSFSGFSVWTNQAIGVTGFQMLQRQKYGQVLAMCVLSANAPKMEIWSEFHNIIVCKCCRV